MRRGQTGVVGREREGVSERPGGCPTALSDAVGCDLTERIRLVPHHEAHAASSYYPSGFDSAACWSLMASEKQRRQYSGSSMFADGLQPLTADLLPRLARFSLGNSSISGLASTTQPKSWA